MSGYGMAMQAPTATVSNIALHTRLEFPPQVIYLHLPRPSPRVCFFLSRTVGRSSGGYAYTKRRNSPVRNIDFACSAGMLR